MKSTKSSIISVLGLTTLACAPGWAQANTTTQTYTPGVTYQAANPNYPLPNPFYFEGRIDWNLLKIDQPKNAWEYMERGIHNQDDLEDEAAAIKDYQTAISLNNLDNGTCQLVTAPLTGVVAGQQFTLNPPPCIFTVRLRLGYLLRESDPNQAINLFQQVLNIDPMRLGVNALIGEVYATMTDEATDANEKQDLREKAIAAYKAELALSPVTPLYTQLTGDEANNAHVHWALAEIYRKAGDNADAVTELQSYLKATKWHSDTYPWRIQLAQKRITQLQEKPGAVTSHHRK